MYLLMRVKSLMSLKVRSNLGPPKKFSKSPQVGPVSVNHAKSNFFALISQIIFFLAGFLFENIISFKFALFSLNFQLNFLGWLSF